MTSAGKRTTVVKSGDVAGETIEWVVVVGGGGGERAVVVVVGFVAFEEPFLSLVAC